MIGNEPIVSIVRERNRVSGDFIPRFVISRLVFLVALSRVRIDRMMTKFEPIVFLLLFCNLNFR